LIRGRKAEARFRELCCQVGVGARQRAFSDYLALFSADPHTGIAARYLHLSLCRIIAENSLHLGVITTYRLPPQFPGCRFDEKRRELHSPNPQRDLWDVLPNGLADPVFFQGTLPALEFVRVRLPRPIGVVSERCHGAGNECESGVFLLVQGDMLLPLAKPEAADGLK